MSLCLNLNVGLKGRFNIKVHAPSGKLRFETEFDNLLLNQGLDWYGNNLQHLNSGNQIGSIGWYYCGMGTGTTPPVVTDTQLENMLGVQLQNGTTQSIETVSPSYGQRTVTYIFQSGSFGENSVNLTEVGVGPYLEPGEGFPQLIARQLIKNPAGEPITLTVLPQETVTVTYILRLYIPEDDVAQVLDISTPGGTVSTTFTTRASQGANSGQWNFPTNRVEYWTSPNGAIYPVSIYGDDFTLSTITGIPTATQSANSPVANPDPADYIIGSYSNVGKASWVAGNPTGGFTNDEVGGAQWHTTLGVYQIDITPHITKRNVDQLDMEFRLTWGRYTPP